MTLCTAASCTFATRVDCRVYFRVFRPVLYVRVRFCFRATYYEYSVRNHMLLLVYHCCCLCVLFASCSLRRFGALFCLRGVFPLCLRSSCFALNWRCHPLCCVQVARARRFVSAFRLGAFPRASGHPPNDNEENLQGGPARWVCVFRHDHFEPPPSLLLLYVRVRTRTINEYIRALLFPQVLAWTGDSCRLASTYL